MPSVLVSRRVLTDSGPAPGAVVVDEGKVVAVLDEPPAGADVEDLGELVLAPSLVDCHVHVNEPGRTEWEGFDSATRAAAAGGISALVDMPLNSDPVTTSLRALEAKLAATAGKLWVDCAFWGGVVPGNAAELAPMVARGVQGFKAFLCHSGIDDFPASDEPTLREAMPILRDCGVPLLVHAELEAELASPPPTDDVRAYLRYLHSRPREWEDRAIALTIELARQTGCRCHVVHLSSATALPLIRRAKDDGVPITVETCPHYLCLTAEDVPDGATEYKCAPPIRQSENREALWRGLADGTIDLVVTDHSPCVPALKRFESGDFLEAWGGIASLQLGLANVWTEARRRGFSLRHVMRWMGRGPRELLGWPEGLQPGVPADLVAFDAEADFLVSKERLLQRHPITPYLGRELHGVVCHTWVRGHQVLRHGSIVGDPVGRVVLRRSS